MELLNLLAIEEHMFVTCTTELLVEAAIQQLMNLVKKLKHYFLTPLVEPITSHLHEEVIYQLFVTWKLRKLLFKNLHIKVYKFGEMEK
jgi:hypothetical protein